LAASDLDWTGRMDIPPCRPKYGLDIFYILAVVRGSCGTVILGKDEQFPQHHVPNTSPLGQCFDNERHMMSCHHRDFLCAAKRLVVEELRAH
jgi:hypothetical protein